MEYFDQRTRSEIKTPRVLQTKPNIQDNRHHYTTPRKLIESPLILGLSTKVSSFDAKIHSSLGSLYFCTDKREIDMSTNKRLQKT